MKKLLVLMLVLGVASVASAGLTWNESAQTVTKGDVASVDIIGTDTAGSYSVDATSVPVASITVTALALAGGEASVYQYAVGHTYEGYIWLQVMDSVEPFTSGPGAQFNVAIDTTGFELGDYVIYADIYGVNSAFTLTVIPEPVTMGLLAVGGLFLRRRK